MYHTANTLRERVQDLNSGAVSTQSVVRSGNSNFPVKPELTCGIKDMRFANFLNFQHQISFRSEELTDCMVLNVVLLNIKPLFHFTFINRFRYYFIKKILGLCLDLRLSEVYS